MAQFEIIDQPTWRAWSKDTAEAAHTKVDPSAPISEIRTLVSPLRKTAVTDKLWHVSPPHSSSKLQNNILRLSQESSRKDEEKSYFHE